MRKILPFLVGVVLAVGFIWGLIELWRVRFATGDVYPMYSSLRSDPLGVKILYEGLARLPGVRVQRHYRPFAELPVERGTTLFLLGISELSLAAMPVPVVQHLEAFVQRGGRLLVALAPGNQLWRDNALPIESADETAQGEDVLKPSPLLPERWGARLESRQQDAGKGQESAMQWSPLPEGLPQRLPWHTTLMFTSLDEAWRVLYGQAEQAMLVERSLGQGTVVLMADAYLFSNEAMWRERQTALLAWLVGPHRTMVFDETHLGIQEQAGVMTLVRTYRLHGVVVGLLLLGGLFVWRNTTSLVPPTESAAGSDATMVAGQDSTTGLASLLQRYIARQDLLRLCLEEWHKAEFHNHPRMPAKFTQMQQVITEYSGQPRNEQRLVDGYRALSRIVQTKG